MITPTNVEFLTLTKELAVEFSQMRAMPGERPLKPHRIHYFQKMLKDKKFNVCY